MEVLTTLGKIAKLIYDQCEEAKTNKKLCSILKKRIKLLMKAVDRLEKQPDKITELDEALEDFKVNLENAQAWVTTYSNQTWWKEFFLAISIYRKFVLINNQLRETAEAVQILLQAQHREDFLNLFKGNCWKLFGEDVENLILLIGSDVKKVSDNVDTLTKTVLDIKAVLMPESLEPWNIKEIPSKELTHRSQLLSNDDYTLYIGERNMSPVLIKVLKGHLSTDNSFVRRTFESECKIMKKYESHNILKLYGMCIDQTGTGPCYSLVTEYCEKGTLRDLLQKEPGLISQQRLLMALDAAIAVYWIHQTEKKAILHGNLNSLKFLVTASYNLKLSGFEFSKTESSMRRNAATRPKQNTEWAYFAPETLKNINAYDMRSEIYSLGIVIYEIATGSLPLQGLPQSASIPERVYERVTEEVCTGLKGKCPSALDEVIHQCLYMDPLLRPWAKGIVNQLMAHVQKQQPTPIETTV